MPHPFRCVLVAVLGLIAGCGGNANGQAPEPTTAAAAPAPAYTGDGLGGRALTGTAIWQVPARDRFVLAEGTGCPAFPSSQFLYNAPAKMLEYGMNMQLCVDAVVYPAARNLSQIQRAAMTALATDSSESRWLTS